MRLRGELLENGVRGFQWIDGSFIEDVELLRGRPPDDIDVVSFVRNDIEQLQSLGAIMAWGDSRIKQNYHVHHFQIPLASDPEEIVELTRFFCGLFMHQRNGTWKGILRVELPCADEVAANHLLEQLP